MFLPAAFTADYGAPPKGGVYTVAHKGILYFAEVLL